MNNQNFIMGDEETGSWWQQISGEAIQGKLNGQKLENVEMDELSFDVWKRENPNGRVLRPDEKILAAQLYESADWEAQVGKMPVRISAELDKTLEPRTLIVGIEVNGKAQAYPFSAIEKQSPILDTVGGTDLVLILDDDGKSVRAFERTIDGWTHEFVMKLDTRKLYDTDTASVWDFSRRAVSGPLAGKQLKRIEALKDYWFDGKTYHPDTQLYTLGAR